MLRVSLIGPGDIKFHFQELLNISEEDLKNQTEEIGKILSETKNQLIIFPDKGLPFEIAKKYKLLGGTKVCGAVPLSDKDFGIEHLKPFLNKEIDGKKIVDEIIDTENWYKQDIISCLLGDVVLVLGLTLGSLLELCGSLYLYKIFAQGKPNLQAMKEKIHPQIRAGEKIAPSVIIYKPFLKEKLNYEIEEYIKKLGNLYYVNNPRELKTILNSRY